MIVESASKDQNKRVAVYQHVKYYIEQHVRQNAQQKPAMNQHNIRRLKVTKQMKTQQKHQKNKYKTASNTRISFSWEVQ